MGSFVRRAISCSTYFKLIFRLYSILIILAFSMIPRQSVLAIVVGGVINTNTNWTLNDSPVIVQSSLQLSEGRTLTIDPGVVIRFAGAYEFQIHGVLIADGTTTSPITFGSITPGVNTHATALRFEGTDLSRSNLGNIIIQDVDFALLISVDGQHYPGRNNSGTLTINGLTVHGADIITDGLETTAALILENVDLDGVTVRSKYPAAEPITILGGEFKNGLIICQSNGISKSITLESVTARNSEFLVGCCGANITLRDCRVYDSSIYDSNNSYEITIESSILWNTPINLWETYYLNITDSLLFYDGGIGIVAWNPVIKNASIFGADTAIRVRKKYDAASSIASSLFSSNDVSIEVNDAPKSKGAGSLTVSGCNFFLNGGANIHNTLSGSVDAVGNYWGTSDPGRIEQSIIHFNDDITLGLVNYDNYLSDFSTDAPISPLSLVQEVRNPDGSREVYWSRAFESDVTGYRVHLLNDADAMEPVESFDVGDVASHVFLEPLDAGIVLAVTAYDADADGQKDLFEGHESWFTKAVAVDKADWFTLHLQPYLSPDGSVSNPYDDYCSARILSWTLPPSVRVGQVVESTIRIEYTDEAMPSGMYDRDRLVSASVFGNWMPSTELSRLVQGKPNGEPRIVEYDFSFVAPASPGQCSLRFGIAYGDDTGSPLGIMNYYGTDGVASTGPNGEKSFRVVAENSAPLPPAHLTATAGAESVLLNWLPNTEFNLSGYNVYRSFSANYATALLLTDESIRLNTWQDHSVIADQTYYYWVTAVNESDGESDISAMASATAGHIVVTIDDTFGGAGEPVHLLISAANATGVAGNGLDLRVTFNPLFLTPQSVTTTPLTQSILLTDNLPAVGGQISINGIASNGSTILGQGALVDILFKVSPFAPPGITMEHVLTIEGLFNGDNNPLAVNFSDRAIFTVSDGYSLGDISGDGMIDSHDELMALQHASGHRVLRQVPPEFPAADINKDGTVDAADVSLIQQLALDSRDLMTNRNARIPSKSAEAFISAPSVSTRPNDIIQIPIQLQGELAFASIDFSLIFDSKVIKLTSIQKGALCEYFDLGSDHLQGAPNISLAWSEEVVGGGDIVILEFKVIGDEYTNSPLKISRLKLSGEQGENLLLSNQVGFDNGHVEVGQRRADAVYWNQY